MKVFVTGAGGLLGQGLLRSLFASSSAMTPVIRSGAARPRTLLDTTSFPDPVRTGRLIHPRIDFGGRAREARRHSHWQRRRAPGRRRSSCATRTGFRRAGGCLLARDGGIADDKYRTYEFLEQHRFDPADLLGWGGRRPIGQGGLPGRGETAPGCPQCRHVEGRRPVRIRPGDRRGGVAGGDPGVPPGLAHRVRSWRAGVRRALRRQHRDAPGAGGRVHIPGVRRPVSRAQSGGPRDGRRE